MWITRFEQIIKLIILGVIFVTLCIIGSYYFIAFALVCLIYGLIEPYRVENKEILFSHDKIPEAFEDFKILFISDIHHGVVYSSRRVRELVNQVNLHKPDLILLGGDYVDQKEYINSAFKELKNLKAKHGVYGVLGNHDHDADAKAVAASMEEAGISCLENRAIWLKRGKERIRIGGVGDFWKDVQDLKPTLKEVKDEFVILLSHNPDYAEEIKDNKISLVLSGHTHGGQGTIFGLWAPFIPSKYGQRYRTGLIEAPETKVLVSNGIGNVGRYIPIRFFARPQLCIIYLSPTRPIGGQLTTPFPYQG